MRFRAVVFERGQMFVAEADDAKEAAIGAVRLSHTPEDEAPSPEQVFLRKEFGDFIISVDTIHDCGVVLEIK